MCLWPHRARSHAAGPDRATFDAAPVVQDAVIRCLEVIGEAARTIGDDTRAKAPSIPWPLIVGMRHLLAHDYGGVSLRIVWEVMTSQLPDLITRLDALAADLDQQRADQAL